MNIKKIYKSKRLLLLLIIVAVVVLGSIFIFNSKKSTANVQGGILQEGIIPGYTEEQVKEILQRKADESSFSFEVNSRPIFKDGKSEGNLRIANPPYNKYQISVQIKLDDSNEIVFDSGKIPPNHYIENAKLNKCLKAGEYNATATISAYDSKTGAYKGMSAAKLIIKVES